MSLQTDPSGNRTTGTVVGVLLFALVALMLGYLVWWNPGHISANSHHWDKVNQPARDVNGPGTTVFPRDLPNAPANTTPSNHGYPGPAVPRNSTHPGNSG